MPIHSVDYNPLLHYLFWYSNCPRFDQEEPLQSSSCVLLICACHLSIFWQTRCSRLILQFLKPSSGIIRFFREHSELGVFISASIPLSYVYTQIYTPIHLCMYLFLSLHLLKNMSSDIFYTTGFILISLLAIFVTFLWCGEPGFHYSQYVDLFAWC